MIDVFVRSTQRNRRALAVIAKDLSITEVCFSELEELSDYEDSSIDDGQEDDSWDWWDEIEAREHDERDREVELLDELYEKDLERERLDALFGPDSWEDDIDPL